MGKPTPEKKKKRHVAVETPTCYFCRATLESNTLCYMIDTPAGVGFSHVESETHHVPEAIRHANVVGERSYQPLHLWRSV
jgi:hypothetical protein